MKSCVWYAITFRYFIREIAFLQFHEKNCQGASEMDTESTSNGTISCAKNSKHPLDFFKEISDECSSTGPTTLVLVFTLTETTTNKEKTNFQMTEKPVEIAKKLTSPAIECRLCSIFGFAVPDQCRRFQHFQPVRFHPLFHWNQFFHWLPPLPTLKHSTTKSKHY